MTSRKIVAMLCVVLVSACCAMQLSQLSRPKETGKAWDRMCKIVEGILITKLYHNGVQFTMTKTSKGISNNVPGALIFRRENETFRFSDVKNLSIKTAKDDKADHTHELTWKNPRGIDLTMYLRINEHIPLDNGKVLPALDYIPSMKGNVPHRFIVNIMFLHDTTKRDAKRMKNQFTKRFLFGGGKNTTVPFPCDITSTTPVKSGKTTCKHAWVAYDRSKKVLRIVYNNMTTSEVDIAKITKSKRSITGVMYPNPQTTDLVLSTKEMEIKIKGSKTLTALFCNAIDKAIAEWEMKQLRSHVKPKKN